MKQLIIGIAGPSAGGKTTVTKKIVNEFDSEHVTVISLDDYYNDQSNLDFSQRLLTNYDHPDAFDLNLLNNHLLSLINGESILKPVYNFVDYNRSEQVVEVSPKQIIIVEGLFSLYRESLYNLFDIKLYVEADSDLCFIRRLKRDMSERGRSLESITSQYLESVKPMYESFVKPTRKNADIIIPSGGENDVAIDVIVKKINDHLNGGNNE